MERASPGKYEWHLLSGDDILVSITDLTQILEEMLSACYLLPTKDDELILNKSQPMSRLGT